MTLPDDPSALGWRTDLAVLRLGGAAITDRDDHLIVRSPGNPRYHWGNFVLVTDPGSVNDADRWLAVFVEEFPEAAHRAVGLIGEVDVAPWQRAGLAIEHEDVRAAGRAPTGAPLPAGYRVRQLTEEADWAAVAELNRRIDAESGSAATDDAFLAARLADHRRVVDTGRAAFFGAFADGASTTAAASLGIVDCGDGRARDQSVSTAPEHRRRGLASHLLGVAGGWAADRGCHQWVIVADADSDASRLYGAAGFAPVTRSVQAYRPFAVAIG